MEVVCAKGLVRRFNSVTAVNGVSFRIEAGECFGFLGPNGAGKTTLMRMIYCFLPPTSGRLEVFGMDVLTHPSEIKARIGVMPQEDNIDIDLSALENLVVYAKYFGIKGKDAILRAERLLEFVGLREKAMVNVQKLSGGMKRRLVLGRALINDPELIILDEPTTGLDPHSRRQVWQMIKEKQSEGKTLILSTHYMEEAQFLCDRVAIMDKGRFLALDSPSNLMAAYAGTLEEVYMRLTGKEFFPKTDKGN